VTDDHSNLRATGERQNHLLAALGQRSFLISDWPWRSLTYVVSTVPVAVVPALGVAVPVLGAWAMLNAVREGRPVSGAALVFTALAVIVVATITVPLSIPLAAVERRRLRVVDHRAVAPAGGGAGVWSGWLYLLALGTVVPLAYGLLGLLALLDIALITSPLLPAHAQPVTVSFVEVSSGRSAVAAAVAGLLMLPVLPYLVALLAAGQAALVRRLLTRPDRTRRSAQPPLAEKCMKSLRER
jgi:hypothetical protein